MGGVDPLISLLVLGTSDRSQRYVSGALVSLCANHPDNRYTAAKRLVGYIGSTAAAIGDRGVRVLLTCSEFTRSSGSNQMALAKAGGIPVLIPYLTSGKLTEQEEAASTLLSIAIGNTATQNQIVKSNGVPPLIGLIRKSSARAQDFSARCLWHLASTHENQVIIAEAGSIRPLVGMLSADGLDQQELAAHCLVRLMKASPSVSVNIAERGGIVPLVGQISNSSSGACQHHAAAMLADLAFVPSIRDMIANAGAIKKLIDLLTSPTEGTPEMAARVLAHLALSDDSNTVFEVDGKTTKRNERQSRDDPYNPKMKGSDERRAAIKREGGVSKLITLLDGSNLEGVEKEELKGIDLPNEHEMSGMNEQAAATLAELALNNAEMQDSIIEAGSVPHLLVLIRTGSPHGQEYAARAIRNLVTFQPIDAALIENQNLCVECGTISDLVQLTKTGSQEAQLLAAAGISELASGAVYEREMMDKNREEAEKRSRRASRDRGQIEAIVSNIKRQESKGGGLSRRASKEEEKKDRLVLIAEAGGIVPLVSMLSTQSDLARENAAGALMHLALDKANATAIASAQGILPLVTLLDQGTEQAHKHAAEAILRLCAGNADNQTQSSKHLVGLLSKGVGTQCRTARVLSEVAKNNPGSPVIIVNAGAISPLVNLLGFGVLDVKIEVAGALQNLSLNSPDTQLAIATGLVHLLGQVEDSVTHEHVTRLLLTLVNDPTNCAAVSRTEAVQRLIHQLRSGTSTASVQELSAAVLAQLSSSSDKNVDKIAGSHAIKPLVALLSTASPTALAHVASILSDLARRSETNQRAVVAENAIASLVAILARDKTELDPGPCEDADDYLKLLVTMQDDLIKAKAQAAGALLCLSAGQPEIQKDISSAGAIKLIVALLDEHDELARKKAAGAIAALSGESSANQDAVAQYGGIDKIVGLLGNAVSSKVNAELAAALAALCNGNQSNQEGVRTAGGIAPLVGLLQVGEGTETATVEAAAMALWTLATNCPECQVAVAEAEGIPPLVAVLGLLGKAQENAGGALAALALGNADNQKSVAKLIVSLLGSDNRQASFKASFAIQYLANEDKAGSSFNENQDAIAEAGGVSLLVKLLSEGGGSTGDGGITEVAAVKKEIASAIWCMADQNWDNQTAIAEAGGIELLVAMLGGTQKPDVHRVVAGALWAISGNPGNYKNQMRILEAGGVAPLVKLLKTGTESVQETVAGALSVMAEAYDNRVSIAQAGGIPLLVNLLNSDREECKDEAAVALKNLILNPDNRNDIMQGLVEILESGTMSGKEHVTLLMKTLAEDAENGPENRQTLAKAGAVPKLVFQLESGSAKAMKMAAGALILIALESRYTSVVTSELVKLLGSKDEGVRQRASDALRALSNGGAKGRSSERLSAPRGEKQLQGLVNLLKEGLRDDRVEAQEYALRSLATVTEAESRQILVKAGCIPPIVESLQSLKLSQRAEEHASIVLSGLALEEEDAKAIQAVEGVEPLVRLLSKGNMEAKRYSAMALAMLARHADAGNEISEAGGVSALVVWLADGSVGPPEVAAYALSEIALGNADTQTQIVEEGAVAQLVEKIVLWIDEKEKAGAVVEPNGRFGSCSQVGDRRRGDACDACDG